MQSRVGWLIIYWVWTLTDDFWLGDTHLESWSEHRACTQIIFYGFPYSFQAGATV